MFNIIIKNGRIVDGSGNPWFKADVAIEDGKIAEIGALAYESADRVIDASNLVVSAGWIDIHDHSELSLLANPRADSKIRQGVTTEVNGNCGVSPAPGRPSGWVEDINRLGINMDWKTLEGYLARLEKQGVSENVATCVGHANIRLCVMTDASKKTTAEELEKMKVLVAEAMEDGAFGLSADLCSYPGAFADKNELVELCKIVAKYHGLYLPDQRGYDVAGGTSLNIEDAARESIEIAEEAGLPVHISHFHMRYPGGKSRLLLQMVDDARKRGVDVTFDVVVPEPGPSNVPIDMREGYHWGESRLSRQFVPYAVYEGGIEKIIETLRDPKMREKFKREHVPHWKVQLTGNWDS